MKHKLRPNMKGGWTIPEIAIVIVIVSFLSLSVFYKTQGAEADIKGTIVKDDINEIFNAVAKAKVSPTVGNGSFLNLTMQDIKDWLPNSMTLIQEGGVYKVGSLNPEVGTAILYSLAHANSSGTTFKIVMEADEFISQKAMPANKVALLETNAKDAVASRSANYIFKDDATAIGTAGSDFANAETDDYNGIVGFGNLSI